LQIQALSSTEQKASRHRFWLLMTSLVIVIVSAAAGAVTDEEAAARDTALAWLRAVDRGDFAESWKRLLPGCNTFWDSPAYSREMGTIARFLGPIESRKLKSLLPRSTLPDLGPGRFVSVVFDSNYEKQDNLTEIVIVRQEANGTGYLPTLSPEPARLSNQAQARRQLRR
jgi:hypothetical protein